MTLTIDGGQALVAGTVLDAVLCRLNRGCLLRAVLRKPTSGGT